MLLRKTCSESSRQIGARVKNLSLLGRLLDGWQVGCAIIAASTLMMLLIIPRPILPEEIPLPVPRLRSLDALSRQDAAWIRSVENEGLAFHIRQVGEMFRRFGIAASAGDTPMAEQLLSDLRKLSHAVHDDTGLAKLRAYQTRDFLRELEAYEKTSIESTGLRELGGEFIRTATQAGWIVAKHNHKRLLADTETRKAMFRKRWAATLKLERPPFDSTIDEERVIHAFLFQHPTTQRLGTHHFATGPTPLNDAQQRQDNNQYLLKKVHAYSSIDPTYPANYARGLLLLHLNRPEAAAEPLAQHIEDHPDGPYTLRARNALRYAEQHTSTLLNSYDE